MKLAILGSTRGSASEGLIQAIKNGEIDASIEIVISNKKDAGILDRTQKHSLTHEYINPSNLNRNQYDTIVSEKLKALDVDLILLIGYMRILSDDFVKKWDHKIINVHPSLLPKHAGLMDLQAHQAVLDAGDKETGCTIHYVNEVVDGGEIILQKTCLVEPSDTAETLKAKVQALESCAFVETLKTFFLRSD